MYISAETLYKTLSCSEQSSWKHSLVDLWSSLIQKQLCYGRRFIREFKQNNVGKTIKLLNYRRQKAHVTMWNKDDIRAVLLSCQTSTAPFPRRLQTVVNVSIFSFRKRPRWKQLNFSENRKKQCNQSKYMLRKTQGLCRNIFTACRLCRRRRRHLTNLPSSS